MYIRIVRTMMRHSRKRRTLRLSISPTSLLREVANRHMQQRTFAGSLRWPLSRLALFYPLRRVLSIISQNRLSGCYKTRALCRILVIGNALFPDFGTNSRNLLLIFLTFSRMIHTETNTAPAKGRREERRYFLWV